MTRGGFFSGWTTHVLPKNKLGGRARERDPKTPHILTGKLPGSSHEAKVQFQDHLWSVRGAPKKAALNNQLRGVQKSSNSSKATEQLPELSAFPWGAMGMGGPVVRKGEVAAWTC